MKKAQGRANQKKVAKIAKKAVSKTKKLSAGAKKTTAKVKTKARNLLGSAKKQLKDLKKKSSNGLKQAKKTIHASEDEIMDYVKENPIKSLSALALTSLIAGFIAARYNK